MEPKRFYKSSENKVFSGVLGGAGEFFNVDPVLLRVIWILIVVFTGFVPGILAYIIAAIIVPKRPHHVVHEHTHHVA